MPKAMEFCQFVARAIETDTWNIPHIRDGDRWRHIRSSELVENPVHINGRDHYEDAIFRLEKFMRVKGWHTEISDIKQPCHEHLLYQHYRLRCWR